MKIRSHFLSMFDSSVLFSDSEIKKIYQQLFFFLFCIGLVELVEFSRKIFLQEFSTRFSCKIFPSWILIGWLPITLFQMLNFHQSLPFLNWLFPLLLFLQDFPARISRKIFPQEFPARFSRKNFPQEFPTRFSHKIFPQQFPTRFSHKIIPQDFPKLDPDWLAPHHPIPNAKFPPITAFLKCAFSPSPCPTRISHKNSLQDFPRRFSCKKFPQDFPTRVSWAGSWLVGSPSPYSKC